MLIKQTCLVLLGGNSAMISIIFCVVYMDAIDFMDNWIARKLFSSH